MAARRIVPRRLPGEAADAGHQFEFLRMTGRGHVDGEQLAVEGPHRLVDELLVRPGTPAFEPAVETIPNGGIFGCRKQHRRLVRVVGPPAQPLGEVARHSRGRYPRYALDADQHGVRLGISGPVSGAYLRVFRQVRQPDDRPVTLVRLDRPRRPGPELLSAGEKLEQPDRAPDHRTLTSGSRTHVVQGRLPASSRIRVTVCNRRDPTVTRGRRSSPVMT